MTIQAPLSYIGQFDKARRALRQRALKPILLGVRSFREVILNAISAENHLIYCRSEHGNFFIDPSDRVIGSWLLWRGKWQLEEIEQAIRILKQIDPEGGVFVDAGANIGTHTVYAMRSGYFSRSISFEPEPKNANLLRMNIAANGIEQSTVVQSALGSGSKTATLHIHPRNKGAHSIGSSPCSDSTEQVSVPVVRLDDALSANNVQRDQIGLVWVDVEGAEFDVISGLGSYIGRPIALEFYPSRYSAKQLADLRTILKQSYRSLYRLGAAETEEPIDAIDTIKKPTDLLVI